MVSIPRVCRERQPLAVKRQSSQQGATIHNALCMMGKMSSLNKACFMMTNFHKANGNVIILLQRDVLLIHYI